METYCVSYKKYTGNENLSVRKAKKKQVNAFIKLRCLWIEKMNFYKKSRTSQF